LSLFNQNKSPLHDACKGLYLFFRVAHKFFLIPNLFSQTLPDGLTDSPINSFMLLPVLQSIRVLPALIVYFFYRTLRLNLLIHLRVHP